MTDFELILDTMRDLHFRKNSIYRDSFSDTREKYPNTIAVVLNFKLSRIESLLEEEASDDITEDAVLEGINDSLIDIANYCVMELCHRDQRLKDPEERKKLQQACIDHIHMEAGLHPKKPRKVEFRRWQLFEPTMLDHVMPAPPEDKEDTDEP